MVARIWLCMSARSVIPTDTILPLRQSWPLAARTTTLTDAEPGGGGAVICSTSPSVTGHSPPLDITYRLLALLQDHLDLRAVREVEHVEVVGSDEVERTRVEAGRSRKLSTGLGEVTVEPLAYRKQKTRIK